MTSGKRWKHVELVGHELDLRKISWRFPVDLIPGSNTTTDAETSGDEATPPRRTAAPPRTPLPPAANAKVNGGQGNPTHPEGPEHPQRPQGEEAIIC